MPIQFDCTCGKILRVADEHAGRRVRCPECSAATSVPAAKTAAAPEPQFEVVEDNEPPARPKAKPVLKSDDDDDDRPRKRRDDDDDDDDDDRPRKKRTRRDEDDDERDEDRPRKKKKKKRKVKREEEKPQHFGMERGIANSGVAGGLLAMVIAVVWFVVGLMNDWVFYYPPILFFVGVFAVIKGLVGGNDDD